MLSIVDKRKINAAIIAVSKQCHICEKPIRWFHFTKGLCGAFDYVRAHRKCVKKEKQNGKMY